MNTDIAPSAAGQAADPDIGGGRFGWRRLQILAAIAALVSFVAPMVIALSFEPFLVAMAAPFLVGLLLAVKWPRLASAWLGVVSLAVLAFSVPFLGDALTHPEAAVDFVPLSLFALATLVGAAAAIQALLEVRGGRRQTQGPRRVATASAALFLATTAWSVFASTGLEDAVPQADDILITTEDFTFTPSDVSTEPGTISMAVTNHDNTRHTLTITELGIDLSLPPGTTQRVTFTAEQGAYTFFCTPHPDMQGRLVAG